MSKNLTCKACSGKGTVNWSSRFASRSVMSGEIRIENLSVCGVCHGPGFELPPCTMIDMDVDEYHARFG